jgi:DNA mismatch endonuclease, patch repair protein
MQGNRKADTRPEVEIRRRLHRAGLRYRKNARIDVGGLTVTPDVVFRRERLAVFVDGCFWHGCPEHFRTPKTNAEYWAAKIARNRDRDDRVNAALVAEGWEVMRIWEHIAAEGAARDVVDRIARRRVQRGRLGAADAR